MSDNAIREANAAFIVHACNAHDELVASAKALVDPPLRIVGATIEIDCSDHSTALALVARLRAAIAKAGAA
jgi:hypothetical protein